MSLPARRPTFEREFRPLDRQQLERRILETTAEVLGLDPRENRKVRSAEHCRPRWIEAGELLRTMRPFVVYN